MSRDKGHEGKWQERSVTKLDAIDARVTHNHSNVTYFLCLCDTTMITILFSFPHVGLLKLSIECQNLSKNQHLLQEI